MGTDGLQQVRVDDSLRCVRVAQPREAARTQLPVWFEELDDSVLRLRDRDFGVKTPVWEDFVCSRDLGGADEEANSRVECGRWAVDRRLR